MFIRYVVALQTCSLHRKFVAVIMLFKCSNFSASRLLEYDKRALVPINYVILEVIFSQLFHLPEAPTRPIFYGSLLIELCKTRSMPQVSKFGKVIRLIICFSRFIVAIRKQIASIYHSNDFFLFTVLNSICSALS